MAKFKLSELLTGLDFEAGQDHKFTVSTTQRVRLVGMFFDTNKCFLLPSTLPGIKIIKKHYDDHPKSHLLVVGHTDTSGKEAYNETLSLERADAVAAYLSDKAGDWEAFFGEGKPAEKRWGMLEVQHMLNRLPESGPFFFQGKPSGANTAEHLAAVKAYQQSKGLKVDGIAGPNTRKALITDYMSLDQTSLPKGLTLTTHGCGENFPVDDTADGVRNPENRRVEIFFFDEGIDPSPAGKISKKGAKEYPKWLEQVSETVDVVGGGESLEFDLPAQKKQLLEPAIGDFEPLKDSEGEPILLAANDDSLVRSIIEDARKQNEKRGQDATAKTRDFGDFIGFTKVDAFKRPDIRMDHGFLDDGNGNLDTSKKTSPTIGDFLAFQKWSAKLAAAELVRPDLIDGTKTYRHFLTASGTDFSFNYEKFVSNDGAGKFVVESAIEDAVAAAIELNDLTGLDSFLMQTNAIGVGGANGRYPYPGTENWQKAIGAHVIWLEVKVTVQKSSTVRQFTLTIKLNAEDRYNFNPDAKDIATQTPDAENGRFEITGLGKEFDSKGSLKRKVEFTTALGPVADPRTPPGNKTVTKQR